MAEDKQKSIKEILAACRKSDGAADDAAASPPASAGDKGSKDQTGPARAAAPAKKPGDMSVADILAAARAEKAEKASAEQSPPAAKATTAAPQAKTKATAGEKAAPRAPAAKKSAGPMDTSSILAAARKPVKPGPMSKAEAASKGQAVSPAKPTRPAKPTLPVPPIPAKPDYAQPRTQTPPKGRSEPSDRRGFFSVFLGAPLAVGFTTLTVTNLLWVLGLARFMFPNILTEPPSKFKVGFPGDFTPGSVTTKFKAQFGVWIVNAEYDGQLQLVALQTVCTHLGCTPNWLDAEQKFKCPCHGSGFYKDGINFEGPAPRPLQRYAVRIADDGQLEVDKSRTFQQELGQWSDSASFVPV